MTVPSPVPPPTPNVLNWLVRGQLAISLTRAVRLWYVLDRLYAPFEAWRDRLPSPWRYGDLRDFLFSEAHGKSDRLSARTLLATCTDPNCLCHRSIRDTIPIDDVWRVEFSLLTGIAGAELAEMLDRNPFATVHRSIRGDLKLLKECGWLIGNPGGSFCCQRLDRLPALPQVLDPPPELEGLTPNQQADFVALLERLTCIYPNLELVLPSFSDRLHHLARRGRSLEDTPQRRIFFEFDYVLPEEIHEYVDDIQTQIEDLWERQEGGIVQFDYEYAPPERPFHPEIVRPAVYPVCIHYLRRAKYLSAYGQDPEGEVGWHNYRLDRIQIGSLKILAWGDPLVPNALKAMRDSGQLPTPDDVAARLQEAWGFKFYTPAALLVLRFAPEFARRYVQGTMRHPTFASVAYDEIPHLVRTHVGTPSDRDRILAILARRSPQDAYFRATVRPDDINIIHRLRSWRPHGEVIAPLELRRRMAEEARAESAFYLDVELDVELDV